MFDLGKQKIEFMCSCGSKHNIVLQDVIKQKNITCSCGITIQLKDSNNSTKKSVSDINRSMNDLERTLKKIGK